MMDLSNLTIPPELFYSRTLTNSWKPKAIVKISPAEITKKLKKSRIVLHKRKTYRKPRAPELGRIGKGKRSLIKKKKKKVLKSNKEDVKENPNNISIKRTSQQEERKILNEIKLKEEAIKNRIFSTSSISFSKHTRPKGSSFKFFKSKNDRDERESSSDESDDLVPEIRDYSDVPLKNIQEAHHKPKFIIDEAPFEAEEETELDVTTKTIESLLQDLDDVADKATETSEVKNAPEAMESLDGLIETLEGKTPKPSEKKVVEKKKKFMGFGNNQLQIDAGQSKFGLVECKDCGFSYNTNVPEDEKLHKKHHQSVTSIPTFRGWATEDSMEINEWKEHSGRIIRLRPNHKNMKSDFVKEIVEKMELEFGVQEDYEKNHLYLAVYDLKFVGLASVKESVKVRIENEEKEIPLGVQRLYVRPEYRRKGIASATLKTIVLLHEKGELFDLRNDVAFSTPTEDGKKLIKRITGSDNFYTFSS